jgi:tRNA nucleotidyltransferase (CCA-adding enzyme)
LEHHGNKPELWAQLDSEAQTLLGAVAEHAPDAHLVGGGPRDLELGLGVRDLDVVTETPVLPLAEALGRRYGVRPTCHPAFLTCSLPLGTLTLDLAGARSEHYPHPGALPVVSPSTLARDLARRDFSVNTFALGLRAPHPLVSVRGAARDLHLKRLRVLHARSFCDDPTRAVRGSRLAGRLGLTYTAATQRALHAALGAEAHAAVAPARLRGELLLTFAEAAVAPTLAHLAASGALEPLYGLQHTPLVAQLDALKAQGEVPPESYLLGLLTVLSDAAAAAHVHRFGWPHKLLRARERVLRAAPPRSDAEGAVQRARHAQEAGRPAPPAHPQLRGSDVLDLGLPAGPEVGRVLGALAQARRRGQVASFADELELARALVHDILTREKP